jgi:hypothetical protein
LNIHLDRKHFLFVCVVLSVTGFLLLEQLLITDATLAPLNRLRIIFAFGAAVALIVFGIGAAVTANRMSHYQPHSSYYHSETSTIQIGQKKFSFI